MSIRKTIFLFPIYLAPYLINGDLDNLNDSEKSEIDNFIKRNNLGTCLSVDLENSHFSGRNDLNNLGSDVCYFTFVKLPKPKPQKPLHLKNLGQGLHLFNDKNSFELWQCNKHFSGFTLAYKNTKLEFVRAITVNEIFDNYLVCALWASEIDNKTIYEFDAVLKAKLKDFVTKFVTDNILDLIESGLTSSEIGHSLWLTQNHHGAGFFDYSLDDDLENRITAAAQKIPEMYLSIHEHTGNVIADF